MTGSLEEGWGRSRNEACDTVGLQVERGDGEGWGWEGWEGWEGWGGDGGDGELVWKAVEMKGRWRTWRNIFPSIGQENNIAQPKTDK